MIVDCHTHLWQTADQLGQADLGGPATPPKLGRKGGGRGERGHAALRRIPPADPELHWQAARPVDRSLVLGFRSRLLGAEVPNGFVADYVRRHPDKLVGFAGLDPADPDDDPAEAVARAADDLGLRGVVLSPSHGGFHPADTRAMALYAECERRRMPVAFHPGGLLAERACLEYARPALLDEVARAFPKLRIVIGRIGHPWVGEAVVLLAKHRHVHADLAGVLGRPWAAFNALVACHEHGVIGKVLFGSDFPYAAPADAIEALYSVNLLAQGTSLPTVPRAALRGIVERDALTLLGLE